MKKDYEKIIENFYNDRGKTLDLIFKILKNSVPVEYSEEPYSLNIRDKDISPTIKLLTKYKFKIDREVYGYTLKGYGCFFISRKMSNFFNLKVEAGIKFKVAKYHLDKDDIYSKIKGKTTGEIKYFFLDLGFDYSFIDDSSNLFFYDSKNNIHCEVIRLDGEVKQVFIVNEPDEPSKWEDYHEL